jgi:SpoVK/Ycf46/Vps4 family AAA+-type ATPase
LDQTVEAALVQLFVEAKRHQPSVIYIPSLSVWANTLSESARATFSALLEGIPPSDPVLVLGIAEDDDIPFDVRSWFGWQSEGLVELVPPSEVGWR